MNCRKPPPLSDTRASIQSHICRHLSHTLGRHPNHASKGDLFNATSLSLRDRLMEAMVDTEARYRESDAKRIYYLSIEFLMGRSLGNNLCNLGLFDAYKDALARSGADLEEIREWEVDAALGNGGLGRLAACFLDSMASLGYPGYGYGIHYEYGLFKQEIDSRGQKEKPDNWLAHGSPWQIERGDEACIVPVYGRIEHARDPEGNYNPMWLDWKVLIGVPYDMPVAGFGGRSVNFLRLYAARGSQEFDMEIFNDGDYLTAVNDKIVSETVSKVLYPSDAVAVGKELRLVQEYFFVACALRDIVRRYQQAHEGFDDFPAKTAIQLNDTHPSLAVAELMRILVDENGLPWETAWRITSGAIAYTNHTLLSEALEKWPVSLLEHVLPRHLQIIYEINTRFLAVVSARWPGDTDRLRRMSIIEEGAVKQVRMAHLAVVGSHSVNGVAEIHTQLLKRDLLSDFNALWPERFNNKTNGITQRRWLLKANPKLAALISDAIGDGWVTDLYRLRGLEAFADDPSFQEAFAAIKRANKARLAGVIRATRHLTVDPDTLFDIQAKRIHEYKRQLLNVLHIIHQYLSIIEDGLRPAVPRTYIFAGKAAPGYQAAKTIIRLINDVARVVNADKRVADAMKVVFVPDYRVSLAEKIVPAADVSEQISTAGKEASGTGNMKFALNGALTIGTADGANIEIREEVGTENIFIFGLTADAVHRLQQEGAYHPWDYCKSDPELKRVLDALASDVFSSGRSGDYRSVYESLVNWGDPYYHLADFRAYVEAQNQVEAHYLTRGDWNRKAILNVARTGKFSSDRTIAEYAEGIWGAVPVLP